METEPLPSVLGDTRQRVSSLSSAQRTSTRQRGHQWAHLSVPLLSALGGTRQRLLYRCTGVPSLPSVMASIPLLKHLFAECNTRQSDQYTPFKFDT
jgi:hypothetical protein